MSACSKTLVGTTVDCEPSMGGIVKAWIAPANDNATVTESAGVITNISNISEYHAFNFKKNTGSMTSTLNVDIANGVNFVTTNLVLQFNRMDTEKRIEMQALALSDMQVIVKDANGTYWFLGKDEYVNASAGQGHTGTAKTDCNNYQITLTDESIEFPFTVAESVIDQLPE